MGTFLNRYETEIRMGLIVIVALLVLLNAATSYVFHQVKQVVTAELDRRLASALTMAEIYLDKNDSGRLTAEQESYLLGKYDMLAVAVIDPDHLEGPAGSNRQWSLVISAFALPDTGEMPAGARFFRNAQNNSLRIGLTIVNSPVGHRRYLAVSVRAAALQGFARASRISLYLAAGVLILIIILSLILPRLILKPFQEMRQTAEKAGRLPEKKAEDEVAEVIASYEGTIQELKQNEIELQRLLREVSHRADHLEKLHRHVLRSIGSGVINVDPDGRIIACNPAAGAILGYDEREIVGRHYLNAFPEGAPLALMIEGCLNRGEAVARREIEIEQVGRLHLWLGIESSPILDDNGMAVGATLLFTDITEMKQLQSELEMNRRSAALGEMTAGLAHQLRNALAAISGFAHLLGKKTAGQGQPAELARAIKEEAASAETMTRRFLSFARPLTLSCEPFDPDRLVDELVRKYSQAAAERNITLATSSSGQKAEVVGDPLLIREALGNVIDNAIDAAGEGGSISIAVSHRESELCLSVADSGPGIPPSIRENIFTPFVSSKPSGTGLGLALALKIIQLHKGSIVFAPATGEARGTTCVISIPTAGKATESATRPEYLIKKG